MNVIYIVTDTITNLKYLGSKYNYLGNNTYHGSPNCKSVKNKKYKLQQEWKQNLLIRKHTFTFTIIEEIDTNDKNYLIEREFFYQKLLNVVKDMSYINAGYAKKNFSSDHYFLLTDDEKNNRNKKISNTLKNKNKYLSIDERKSKYGHNGDKNGMFGKNHTKLVKEKISNSLCGKPSFKKNKTNVEIYGTKKALKISKKLSIASKNKIGELNPFYGKSHSEETKKKISETKKSQNKTPPNKRCIIINNIKYESLYSASLKLNIPIMTIHNRIKSNNEKFSNYQDYNSTTRIQN